MADLRKIPTILFIGAGVGGVVGAVLGRAACIGYDIVKGPFFPQAGADLNPAGWMGWWLGGGALSGAAVGLLVAAALLGLWRLIVRRG